MSLIHKRMATSLAPGMTSATRERERAVAEIKAQTADALRSFENERMAMAKALKIELAADRLNRSAEVLEIRDNASAMSQDFRQEHQLMRNSLRQTLVDSKQAVSSSVAALFAEFSSDRADFTKALRRMAAAQGAELARDRRERSHAVAQMMRAFTKAHHQMAKVQWAGLAECRRDRSHSLAELMQGFHGTRGHVTYAFSKALPRTMPAAKIMRPVVKPKPAVPAAPAASLTQDLFKPAPALAAPRVEPVKVATTLAKPWPITPPRGEPIKPQAKAAPVKPAPVKATPVKAAIAKSVPPKAKVKTKAAKAKKK